MIYIVYHEDYKKYNLGDNHPFLADKPEKTIKILKSKGLIDNELKILFPTPATEKDLLRVHTPDYIERIKMLSKTGGMLSVDTPVPKGIYDVVVLACGGTKLVAEKVVRDEVWCGINTLAGFHHACKNTASGFCFFNDMAIAIEYIREQYSIKKILIVDTDVHHPNGTQEIFYEDDNVMLVSIHQDGRTLYPGTGNVNEIGRGKGEGFTVNIPLPPHTNDEDYIRNFNANIPIITEKFKPEIIFWQSGVDTYYLDPLARLDLTLRTYRYLGMKMREITKDTCNRLVVCLGGGYSPEDSALCYYNLISGLVG